MIFLCRTHQKARENHEKQLVKEMGKIKTFSKKISYYCTKRSSEITYVLQELADQ